MPENLNTKLDSNRVNRIFVISNDDGYISRLFDRMNAIDTSKFALEVYGLSDWLTMDQINSRYKVKYQLVLPIVHYLDYNNDKIRSYIRSYRKAHKVIPSKFAFLGYDVAYYHLNELLQHGTNYEQNFSLVEPSDGLQSRYHFKQYQEGSGFENIGLFFVRYEDYELVLIDKYPFSSPKPTMESMMEEMEIDSTQSDPLLEDILLDSIPEREPLEID